MRSIPSMQHGIFMPGRNANTVAGGLRAQPRAAFQAAQHAADAIRPRRGPLRPRRVDVRADVLELEDHHRRPVDKRDGGLPVLIDLAPRGDGAAERQIRTRHFQPGRYRSGVARFAKAVESSAKELDQVR